MEANPPAEANPSAFPSLPFDRHTGSVVFVFSMGLLLYELCLTRVLSVFFYYHTAFLAVSLAMLGVGAGGVWVYLFSKRFKGGIAGWMLSVGLAVSVLPAGFSWLRFDHKLMEQLWQQSFVGLFVVVALMCLLPFLLGGVVWAWWFRAYRQDAAVLYGWDLLGAAAGALLLVPVMESFGGPAALLLCGGLLLASTGWYALLRGRQRLSGLAIALAVCVWIAMGVQIRHDVFSIQIDMSPSKRKVTEVMYKKWNAFSRVVLLSQQGWYRAMSAKRRIFWQGKLPKQREALIDINAYAPLIAFDGDLHKVRYLKDLVSNVAYHILPPGRKVAILGPGGGKDVVGALLFKPKKVVGVEINPILVNDIVKGHSRAFTGDLYRHPKVKVYLGDGRAVLQRMEKQRFDLLIANSVATWAAHSSGAMNLAEQSLYTEESCALYFDRLTQKGIISISLWDLHQHALPLRWIATCEQAARERGISSLRNHVAVIGNLWDKHSWFSTVLISNAPFTRKQDAALQAFATKLGYDLLYSPYFDINDKRFTRYFADPAGFVKKFPFQIHPASDDQPFFLYTARWSDALFFWKKQVWEENAALVNLLLSLILVCVLLVLVIGGPLVWHWIFSPGQQAMRGPDMLYFLAIGLGFMLVEIPLIQRFTLYLGHPTYALTVVLAGILLASGVGSLIVGRWSVTEAEQRWSWVLTAICVVLGVLPLLLGPVLEATLGWSTYARIGLTLVLLVPLGMVMGMPLSLGMVYLGAHRPSAIPWAWGINGASSVVASVAALGLAVLAGFQLVFLLAILWYALAWLSIHLQRRPS